MVKSLIRERTLIRRKSTAVRFTKSMRWIHNHIADEGGIQVSSINPAMYPEVTGYYIPTLLNWGEKNLALNFGEALLKIQQPDGSFLDSGSTTKCVFDTGQIIRGLTELYAETNDLAYRDALENSVKWISSRVQPNGDVNAPDISVWGGVIPIGILLYSLEPTLRAAELLDMKLEKLNIENAIRKLLNDSEIENFKSVSHFHAYVLEALVDLGETSRAAAALEKILNKSNFKGWVPGKPGKKWVCSTAMFQYAVVCFKLGKDSEGEKLFKAASRLQNSTGGWYGSYGFLAKLLAPLGRIFPHFTMYFPRTEIPWVNKYFLDSLKLRLESNFEAMSSVFSDEISSTDGRVLFVLSHIEKSNPRNLLDLGCGKGRYIKHIVKKFPGIEIHACDMSENVTSKIAFPVKVSKGSLVKTSYDSEKFDFVITIEALEHAVNVSAAIRELDRVIAPGGTLLIIDKNENKLGKLKLPDWERWFDAQELAREIMSIGYEVSLVPNLGYEERKDGLFFGLVAWKNE